MTYMIPLQPTPAQEFSFIYEDYDFQIRLKYLASGMYIDLYINNEAVCLGFKCINAYNYLTLAPNIRGSLFFLTATTEAPQWERFQSQDFLYYVV